MPYCINPNCPKPENPEQGLFCQDCNSELLIQGKYRAINEIVRKTHERQLISKVFRANDNLGNKVILKVLYSLNQIDIELFEKEIRYLTQLDHPGLPTRQTDGSLEGVGRYLVMENIEGQDLYEYLKNRGRPIDEKTAVNWLKELVNILKYLHQQSIIHRDIKPANIMLRGTGSLVLIDLGAVRPMTNTYIQRQREGELTVVSSVGYTAPEQEIGRTSIQSDFFSLGRTFVHLLTNISPGDLPEDPTTGQITWKDKVKNLSPRLINLIERMMMSTPMNRPQTAQEILDELNRLEKLNEPDPPNKIPNRISKKIILILSILSTVLALGSIAQIITTLVKDERVKFPQLNPTQSPVTFSPDILEYDPIAICRKRRQNPNDKNDKTKASSNQCFHDVTSLATDPKISYGGSTSWATLRKNLESAIRAAGIAIDLRYTPPKSQNPGSSEGIKRLLAEQLDIALSSRPLSKTEKEQGLREETVAYDATIIAVNKNLDVKLTLEQLEKIYTGKVTNWKDINQEYPDLPIEVFARDPNIGGTVKVFIDEVLKGQSLGSKVEIVSDISTGLQTIQKTPGGIFFGSAAEIVDQCSIRSIPIAKKSGEEFVPPYDPEQYVDGCQGGKRNQVNMKDFKEKKYPLVHPMAVIINTKNSEKEKKGELLVQILRTDEGQQLIEQARYIPIVR